MVTNGNRQVLVSHTSMQPTIAKSGPQEGPRVRTNGNQDKAGNLAKQHLRISRNRINAS